MFICIIFAAPYINKEPLVLGRGRMLIGPFHRKQDYSPIGQFHFRLTFANMIAVF